MKKVVLAACLFVTVGLAIAGPPVQAKSAEDGKEAPIKPAELGKEAPIPPPGKQGPGWPQFPGKDGPGVFGKQGPRPPKEKGERKGKEHKKGKHEKGGWKKPPKPYEMDETKKALHDERRKSSGLYAALILPKKPKEVSFPLSEEDSKKFYAARDGLMDWVRETSKEHDLQNEDTKKSLRQKTTDNQEGVRKLMVEAVLAGKTLQQARVGLLIAQFEALPEDFQKKALEKSAERMARMPAGARDKAVERQMSKHKSDLEKLKAMKTPADKEEWVNKQYKSVAKLPKVLQ